LLSITYVSSASAEMSEEAIAGILGPSRANNIRNDLTGALLYHRGRFIQILEGPDEMVKLWFGIIEADPRHRNVQKLSEKAIGERQFPEWTMGFRATDQDEAKKLEGFDDFFGSRTAAERIKHAENEAQQLLEWLAEYWFER